MNASICSDVFPTGIPEQFSFISTYRNKKGASGGNWDLVRIEDDEGQIQMAVRLQPRLKTIQFVLRDYENKLQGADFNNPPVGFVNMFTLSLNRTNKIWLVRITEQEHFTFKIEKVYFSYKFELTSSGLARVYTVYVYLLDSILELFLTFGLLNRCSIKIGIKSTLVCSETGWLFTWIVNTGVSTPLKWEGPSKQTATSPCRNSSPPLKQCLLVFSVTFYYYNYYYYI